MHTFSTQRFQKVSFLLILTFLLVLSGYSSWIGTKSASAGWTDLNPKPTAETYHALGYSNGNWRGVTNSGNIVHSTDGVNWTVAATNPVSFYPNDLEYIGGRWIAVGQGGRVLTSIDGLQWDSVNTFNPLNLTYPLWGIAHNGSTYVLVGQNGTLLTSGDFTTWENRSIAGVTSFHNIIYGGGKFVVIGTNGVIYSSDNGSTWTARTSGVTAALYGIEYADNQFVVVGAGGTVLTSPDGITWTNRTATSNAGSDILYSVTHGYGKYVAVGAAGRIVTSSDSVSWISEASGGADYLRSVGFGGGKFVAVGRNGLVVYKEATPPAPSNNTNLSSLVFDIGVLDQPYRADLYTYTLIVPYTATELKVTPTVEHQSATVAVTGGTIADGVTTVSLDTLPKQVTIRVTAEDGVTTGPTYTINVVRATPSSNSNLSNLQVSLGTLDPTFDINVLEYTLKVASNTPTVTFTPTLQDPNAVVKVNETNVVNGNAVTVKLDETPDPIIVKVIAEDSTEKLYKINVYRMSSNANLSNLTFSTGTLDKTFTKNELNYTLDVPNETTTVNVTPTNEETNATIKVDGTVVPSGQAVQVALVGPNQEIIVSVIAEDGTSKEYTITVNHLPSTDANLSAMTISSGSLTPLFDTNTTAYTTTVAHSTHTMTVTASTSNSAATIRVNGVITASGTASASLPLNVGNNTITFEVTAEDGTTMQTYTITVTRQGSTISSPGSSSGETPPSQSDFQLTVDGVVLGELATVKTEQVNGQKTTSIILDTEKLLLQLKNEPGTLMNLHFTGNSDVVVGVLNGILVKEMELSGTTIGISTEHGTYSLPMGQIDIDRIAAQLGSNVKLEDIQISIKIGLSEPTTAAIIQQAADKGNITIIGAPIDFKVTASFDGNHIEISRFNSFVERQIIVPAGINSAQVTTALVLSSDGSLTHVPTYFTTMNGKTSAVINSLTNSSYVIVNSARTFADIENHWSQQDVNEMASRQVVQGVTQHSFQPNKDITRAEFIAIILRALGIKSGMGTELPKDIQASDWYAGIVQSGISFKLINGYEDGTFRPNQTITRKEAATIIARALTLVGLNHGLTEEDVTEQLESFSDGSAVSEWASHDLALAVKYSILQGADGKISADDNVTRAQATVMVKRLLRQASLIK